MEVETSSIADQIPFRDVSELLEKILKLDTGKKKVDKLRKFCEHFRKVYRQKYKTLDPSEANGDSLYCIIRILFPTEDLSRPPFGFQAVKLSIQFPKILGFDPESVAGQKFIKFKDPQKVGTAAGDLSQIVYDYLETRSSHVSGNPLTIATLHQVLDELAKLFEAGASGKDNADNSIIKKQRPILQNLFRRVSALEGKWLTRILLRRLDLGLQTGPIFNCIHEKAQELYNRTGDLEAVCIELNDPEVELQGNEIVLFKPFQPMLCSRLTCLKDAFERRNQSYIDKKDKKEGPLLPSPPFVLELKFDGERYQLHFDRSREPDDQFRYFSRSRREYSAVYLNLLTPKLRAQIHPSCTSFIMDGELMVWSSDTRNFIQKALSPNLRKTAADHPECKPVFVAFDLVYFNGENLENTALNNRMDILMKKRLVFEPQEGVIVLSEQRLIQHDAKELVMRALNKVVDDGEEGLVIKEYSSKYEIGKRENSWLKLKPEYLSDNSVSDLDLLILGGYFTKSQSKGGIINKFLVGLLDDDRSSTRPPKEKFYAITTVGPGHLKIPQLFSLVKELEPNFIPKEKNPNFNITFDSRPRPDFFLDPTKSIVLQVKASQIIVGDAAKYSLNFPRITCVRPDKSWQDIMTFREFTDLLESSSGRLVKRNDSSPSLQRQSSPHNPSKMSTPFRSNFFNFNQGGGAKTSPEESSSKSSPISPTSPVASATQFTSKSFGIPASTGYKNKFAKLDDSLIPAKLMAVTTKDWGSKRVVNESNILNGRVFLVMGSNDFKSRVTTEIQKHGGQIVLNPTKDLFAVVAETITMRVGRLMNTGSHYVVKYSWLEKSILAGTFQDILPRDCWGAQEEEEPRQEVEPPSQVHDEVREQENVESDDDGSSSPSLFQMGVNEFISPSQVHSEVREQENVESDDDGSSSPSLFQMGMNEFIPEI